MDADDRRQQSKRNLATALAGLEGGTVGVLWMLTWLGFSSLWQQRSFWAPENLMATAFDRNSNLAPVFTWATCAGLALYVVIYTALGAAFSSVVRDRAPRGRVMLLAVVFAVAWYYLSFRWSFKFVLPLVALLHVEHPTLVGHLLYGTMLGRYPQYVTRLMGAATPVVVEMPAPAAIESPVTESVATEAVEERPEGPPPET